MKRSGEAIECPELKALADRLKEYEIAGIQIQITGLESTVDEKSKHMK